MGMKLLTNIVFLKFVILLLTISHFVNAEETGKATVENQSIELVTGEQAQGMSATITFTSGGKSTTKSIDAAIVQVEFKKDNGQKYGFDDVSSLPMKWKSVKVTDTDPVSAEIKPAVVATQIYFQSQSTGKVTLTPEKATGSPQQVTFRGVSKGTAKIEAKGGSLTGKKAGEMSVAAYPTKSKTVAIRLVHEDNDDVQAIQVGRGKAAQTAITAGANGTLDTAPSGDDAVSGTTITTGANGICETAKTGDDVQVIPNGNGKPNEVCVTSGANAARDTNVAGDDTVNGQDITTGPDGICDTAANATDMMSTDATDAAIRSYLNDTVYNQAICTWTVTRLGAMTVNWDLNRDGLIDVDSWMSAEMRIIRDQCGDTGYDHNIFLVDHPTDGSFGFMSFNQRYGFIHGDQSPSIPTTIAHELGHGGFGLTHESGNGVGENIMTQGAQNKWRLFKAQWDTVNP